MILTLIPDTEALLHSVAAQRGLPPEKTIELLLAEAQAEYVAMMINEEETEQVLVALRQSQEGFAAGRWISLEDYEAEIQAERNDRSTDSLH